MTSRKQNSAVACFIAESKESLITQRNRQEAFVQKLPETTVESSDKTFTGILQPTSSLCNETIEVLWTTWPKSETILGKRNVTVNTTISR